MKKPPFKILFIITGLRFGGAEKLLYLTCKYLQKAYDVAIEVVYFDPYAPLKPLFEALGIRLTRYPKHISSYFKLRKHIRRGDFDVIHTHLIHADILGRLAALQIFRRCDSKIFSTAHGTEWFRWQRSFYCALVRLIDRLLSLPRRSHVIAISGSVRDLLIDRQNIRPQKITLLYNAVEAPEKLPKRNKKTGGKALQLLYVGRLTAVKNIPCLLRALASIDDLPMRLDIVGEGETAEELEQLTAQLNLTQRVRFLGAKQDVNGLYLSHDVLILPSKHEGLGIVILEAFCHGLPVIGAKVDGIRELLANGRGQLFENDDMQDLAVTLRMVYQKRDILEGSIEKSFEYVKKYHDIIIYIKKLMQLYQTAVDASDV